MKTFCLWKSGAIMSRRSNVYKTWIETVIQCTLRPRNRIRAPLHLQKVKRPGVEFSCFRWALTWKRVRDFFRFPVPKSCNERLPNIPAIKLWAVLSTKDSRGCTGNVKESVCERRSSKIVPMGAEAMTSRQQRVLARVPSPLDLAPSGAYPTNSRRGAPRGF